MTPQQLLEEAKSRFVVLYHNDDKALNSLLKQALGKYQEKAGSINTVKLTEVTDANQGMVDFPDDFLDIATALDANTCYVSSYADTQTQKISFEIEDGRTVLPITVYYFQNLRDWPQNSNLPAGITSLIVDYLVALIDIPNTERERGAAASTGQTIDLPLKQELMDKVSLLEEAMEESRAVGIPMAVW